LTRIFPAARVKEKHFPKGEEMERSFVLFRTKLGWMGLVGSEKGVQRIYLPEDSREELRQRIGKEFPDSREGARFLEQAREEILEYFEARRTQFGMRLDLSSATPFQRKAYQRMLAIPFGRVHTYRWLAEKIGNPRALRAVGNANGKNRWPLVVPCHRIVGSDGRLTGFSAPGGLDLKAELLKLEGVAVEKGRVISFPPSPGR
jgi:methylated-DNA-[protein]-cysteine S-methyltransferase